MVIVFQKCLNSEVNLHQCLSQYQKELRIIMITRIKRIARITRITRIVSWTEVVDNLFTAVYTDIMMIIVFRFLSDPLRLIKLHQLFGRWSAVYTILGHTWSHVINQRWDSLGLVLHTRCIIRLRVSAIVYRCYDWTLNGGIGYVLMIVNITCHDIGSWYPHSMLLYI